MKNQVVIMQRKKLWISIVAAILVVVLMVLNGFHFINGWVYLISLAVIMAAFYLIMGKTKK